LADTIQAKQESVKALGPQVDPAKKKQEFDDSLRTGDEAYGKGLLAKAAAAYAKAFRADPTQGEIGLRAATLYADRLKNLLEAARLWQQVLAAGEPHATTARAELQSYRDALDELLSSKLAELHHWIVGVVSYANGVRMTKDPAEALRLAEAFPESMELQVELALLYAGNDNIEETVVHLQSAARLGLSADDFLARKEFTDSFARTGFDSAKGRPVAEFVRDAYGDDTLGKIRTELQRRADETVRLAREKAEKERQARLATERKDLTAWRDIQRSKTVQDANRLLSARNDIAVMITSPGATRPMTVTHNTAFSYDSNAHAYVLQSVAIGQTVTTRTHTIPSFMGFSGASSHPSNWINFDPIVPVYGSRPVDPYGPLCKVLSLRFAAGAGIRSQIAKGHLSGDVTRSTDSNLSYIDLQAMLEDAEVPVLQQLFGQLAKFDAAGNDVEKLRQLRK